MNRDQHLALFATACDAADIVQDANSRQVTLQQLVERGARQLRAAGLEQPRAEALLLACHILRLDKASLLAHPELPVGGAQARRYGALIDRRARREPAAYLLGEREFYGRSFLSDPRALVPRPETELLVDKALDELRRRPALRLVIDVGTGSGCIAATLALEAPGLRVVAADISAEALEVARLNVERSGVREWISLVRGDLLTWLRPARLALEPEPGSATSATTSVRNEKCDPGSGPFIVANLPYIPAESLASLPSDVRDYEPRLALDGGPGGARLIARLLEQASALRVSGLLAELDPRHAGQVLDLARACFPARSVEVLVDLAERPRLLRVGEP